MTLPLPAALSPEPAAMPLLDTEDSVADVLLEDAAPTSNLAGVHLLLLSLSLEVVWFCCVAESCCPCVALSEHLLQQNVSHQS